MKDWFNNLEYRERLLLIVGGIGLFLGVLLQISLSVHETKNSREAQLDTAVDTYEWVTEAVHKIKASRGSGASSRLRNKTLIQISELAAGRSGIRSTRFQPSGATDAQIWFEDVPFSAFMQYISRIEQDFGVTVETLSVNSTKVTGLINARVKLSK